MTRFTLTQKTFIFVAVTLSVIVILRVGSARLIILREFDALEADLTRQNMARVLAAVDQECQEMTRLMSDWGAWTDTRDFIRGANPAYVAVNLTADTFANLDLDLIVLADAAKRFRWAGIYTPEETLAPMAPEMRRFLTATASLWEHAGVDDRKVGLLDTPLGLMLVTAGPIVSSDRQGPIAGTIILARRFGPSAVAALEKQMQMKLNISAFTGDPSVFETSADGPSDLPHSAIHVHAIDKTLLKVTTVLWDLAGKPIVALTAQMPRQIFAQGHRTIRLLLFWQALFGVLITLMVILFVRSVILIPIARLTRQVSAIAARSSFSDRLDVITSDEVGATSQAINQMLAALDATNTKLQAAYDELKGTQAQLIQTARLASIGQLAAGMAHELNQPLMVIRGTAQMISRSQTKGVLVPEALPVQLNLIERNTKRMMNIVDHLRAFSNQSEGAHALTDMNKVVKDCFALLGERLRIQGIDVQLTLTPVLPKVMCDRGQMEQVLLNLVTNAQDAILEKRAVVTAEWQGRLEVTTLPAAEKRSAVKIRVRDNGSGISDDRLDWIFDPFFTTKAIGDGAGLGLSISYGIVQQHRGDLRVEVTGPEGTTFVLELPAEPHYGDSPPS